MLLGLPKNKEKIISYDWSRTNNIFNVLLAQQLPKKSTNIVDLLMPKQNFDILRVRRFVSGFCPRNQGHSSVGGRWWLFFLLMFLYYFDDMVMFSLSFDSKKSEVLMLKDLFVGALSSQRLLVSNFDDMTVTSMTWWGRPWGTRSHRGVMTWRKPKTSSKSVYQIQCTLAPLPDCILKIVKRSIYQFKWRGTLARARTSECVTFVRDNAAIMASRHPTFPPRSWRRPRLIFQH